MNYSPIGEQKKIEHSVGRVTYTSFKSFLIVLLVYLTIENGIHHESLGILVQLVKANGR